MQLGQRQLRHLRRCSAQLLRCSLDTRATASSSFHFTPLQRRHAPSARTPARCLHGERAIVNQAQSASLAEDTQPVSFAHPSLHQSHRPVDQHATPQLRQHYTIDLASPIQFPPINDSQYVIEWSKAVHTYCQHTIQRISELIAQQQQLHTTARSLQIVQLMDDISNALCTLLDTTNYLRSTHPSQQWIEEITPACDQLLAYLESLNQHPTLIQALRTVNSGGEQGDAEWPAEAARVAKMLQDEMEQHGTTAAHSDHVRQRIAQLTEQIYKLSYQFTQNITHVDSVYSTADYHHPDEHHRRRAYERRWQAAGSNVQLLNQLSNARAELTELANTSATTYADLKTADCMAQSSKRVIDMCEQTLASITDQALQELQQLSAIKRKLQQQSKQPIPASPSVNEWDIPYLINQVRQRSYGDLDHRTKPYFTFKNVANGLTLLGDRVFGLHLEFDTQPSTQLWHSSVQTARLYEKHELIGIIYFDLFQRPNKRGGAYSATFQCGRRSSASNRQNQLPIITMSCNFYSTAKHDQSVADSTLNWHSVHTIYHEFGHCLHHCLARGATYQHTGGLRGEVDMVEMPSQLMERFLYVPDFVQAWAVHATTRTPISTQYLQQLSEMRYQFMTIEMAEQLVTALYDQLLHSQSDASQPADSSRLLQQLAHRYPIVPRAAHSKWHAFQEHLCSYGAGYYSYFWCQVLAEAVWQRYFNADPMSRSAGDALRYKLFHWGGSKPAAQLAQGLLADGQSSNQAIDVTSMAQAYIQNVLQKVSTSNTV